MRRRTNRSVAQTVRVLMTHHVTAQVRIDPPRRLPGKGRINGKPLYERLAARTDRSGQVFDRRPWRLRIDVIRAYGRHAAPVIDTRIDQSALLIRRQIWRRLDIHGRAEQQSRNGNGPTHFLCRRGRHGGHAGSRLRLEVLDDQFLDMTMNFVQIADRQQGVDPLHPRFTDTDQQPSGEGNTLLPCETEGFKARGRVLVGGPEVRPAAQAKSLAGAFQHQSLGDGDLSQLLQIAGRHHAWIDVRQQPGLPMNETSNLNQIGDRRLVSEISEFRPRLRVPAFRFIAQSEQHFRTPRRRGPRRPAHYFITAQVHCSVIVRGLGKSAVVAHITAKLSKRNKHVARKRHDRAMARIPNMPSTRT